MCYSLISLLVMPIFCTLETILRVIMTIALAAEDLLRLVIQAIHSWVSTILHAVAVIPLWFVFCCSQKCFCSQICTPICSPSWSPGCYPMRNNCGCILFLTMTLVFVLIYLFTNWWEDLFATFGLEVPCFYEKKADETEPQVADKIKSEPMIAKLAQKRVQITKKSENKRHTTKSIKHVRKTTQDMVHDLDVSYIEHFKERRRKNASKFRTDETNFTYVTVTINAILDEPDDDETLR